MGTRLDAGDLGQLFGIELAPEAEDAAEISPEEHRRLVDEHAMDVLKGPALRGALRRELRACRIVRPAAPLSAPESI